MYANLKVHVANFAVVGGDPIVVFASSIERVTDECLIIHLDGHSQDGDDGTGSHAIDVGEMPIDPRLLLGVEANF